MKTKDFQRFLPVFLECHQMMLVIGGPFLFDGGGVESQTFKLSTYNLWNVMFNWDVRKFHISQMVSGDR